MGAFSSSEAFTLTTSNHRATPGQPRYQDRVLQEYRGGMALGLQAAAEENYACDPLPPSTNQGGWGKDGIDKFPYLLPVL